MEVKIAGFERHSAVNGPGVRYVIFFQGCAHRCVGCQNPETQPLTGGRTYQSEDIVQDVLKTKYLDGVTFSGGDPFCQPEAIEEIGKELHKSGFNIWSYTGWTWEELLEGKAGEKALAALQYIDVLVDGPFVLSLRSENCLFRGSTNQRLIDVQRSLREKKAVELANVDFNL